MGFFSSPPPKKANKIQKCPGGCKKSVLACTCNARGKGTAEKAKVQVKGSDGRTRTVTKNTGNTIRDGNTWCACGCLIRNGRCSNFTCSTNRGS